MYCDLWPYVLWPLDFQIQKRIVSVVSAETIWGNTVSKFFDCRISANSFRGNYSFLNFEIQRSQYLHKCEETIQGQKLYEEIRYIRPAKIMKRDNKNWAHLYIENKVFKKLHLVGWSSKKKPRKIPQIFGFENQNLVIFEQVL